MVLGRPLISSALLHMGVLLALWIGFAPKAFDSVYFRPIWIETDRAEIGFRRSVPAPKGAPQARLPRAQLKPNQFEASKELHRLTRPETFPATGRVTSEYNEFKAKIRAKVFEALETPWSTQKSSLQRRGISGRVILR